MGPPTVLRYRAARYRLPGQPSGPIARLTGFWHHYYSPQFADWIETHIIADTAGFNCPLPVAILADSVVFNGPLNQINIFYGVEEGPFLQVELARQGAGCIIGNVSDTHGSSSVAVFPTVSSGAFTARNDGPARASIRVMGQLGNVLQATELPPHSEAVLLLPENCPSGMYYVLTTTPKSTSTLKIIKE